LAVARRDEDGARRRGAGEIGEQPWLESGRDAGEGEGAFGREDAGKVGHSVGENLHSVRAEIIEAPPLSTGENESCPSTRSRRTGIYLAIGT
jgi:hypothetical protein